MTKVQALLKLWSAALAKAGRDGWTVTRGKGMSDGYESWAEGVWGKGAWVRFDRDGVTIVLNFSLPESKWDKERSFSGVMIEGHTLVDGGSFTRRGVDTCSCSLSPAEHNYGGHDYTDLPALLAGEYARCLASREREKTAVAVPGLPFSVQPDWFETASATLKAGKVVSLTPSGFGTGYTLSRRPAWRSAKRASAELEAKLGVGPVFVETFDHD